MRRVLVLTDQPVVIQLVRAAMQRVAGLELVGVGPAWASARPALRQAAPDLVLIDDASAPKLTLNRIREVAAATPNAKCVVLAPAMSEAALKPKFDAGADAAIAGRLDSGTLGRLLCDVAEERVLQRPRWDGNHAGLVGHGPLTTRELEILRLVAEGSTNAGIARTLTVAEQTVKFHVSNIYRKLGVGNRTAASRYAHAHHLVDGAPHPREPSVM
jgi:DNA-binding NarL/FixJ family response regulator